MAAHQAGMQVYIVPDLEPPPYSAELLAQGTFSSLNEVARNLEIALNNPKE